MNKDDLVQEIGTLLVEDPDISPRPWRHLVMVAQLTAASTEVRGFAYYDTGEAVPVSPDNFDTLDKFEELRDVMQAPGKAPWRACLVRIDSMSGKIAIDFEYDHPEKWLISPASVQKMAEILRPAEA